MLKTQECHTSMKSNTYKYIVLTSVPFLYFTCPQRSGYVTCRTLNLLFSSQFTNASAAGFQPLFSNRRFLPAWHVAIVVRLFLFSIHKINHFLCSRIYYFFRKHLPMIALVAYFNFYIFLF